ncbi:MAG: tetratricopeptide repeat protein [Burkholderiales bacterium]
MRTAVLVLGLVFCTAAAAQPSLAAERAQAVKALSDPEPARRAEGVIWIAEHGTAADDKLLQPRLRDEHPQVREFAEQGMWLLWSRSGDKAVDALMEEGAAAMAVRQFDEAIAIYTQVIRRKPAFAEGWNKRATVYFLAGDFKRSLADCDQVMKRKPQHFGALSGYGQIYFQMKQYDKAIAYWKRALDANPNLEGLNVNIELAEKLLAEVRKHSA